MIVIKFILMMVILVGMVVLLMSVRLLVNPESMADDRETDVMRKDVERENKVITTHSVFHSFLGRDSRKRKSSSGTSGRGY